MHKFFILVLKLTQTQQVHNFSKIMNFSSGDEEINNKFSYKNTKKYRKRRLNKSSAVAKTMKFDQRETLFSRIYQVLSLIQLKFLNFEEKVFRWLIDHQ